MVGCMIDAPFSALVYCDVMRFDCLRFRLPRNRRIYPKCNTGSNRTFGHLICATKFLRTWELHKRKLLGWSEGRRCAASLAWTVLNVFLEICWTRASGGGRFTRDRPIFEAHHSAKTRRPLQHTKKKKQPPSNCSVRMRLLPPEAGSTARSTR